MNLPLYALLRWGWIGLLGLAIFIAVFSISSAPSRPAIRLGLRGLKRQRLLETNETWQGIEPLIRWLGVRVSGILSDEQHEKLNNLIALGGDYLGLTAEEFVALTMLSMAGGLGMGITLGWMFNNYFIFGMVGILFGLLAPYLQLGAATDDRMQEMRRGLPYAIDLMSLSMGAGLDFPGAVRQVVEKSSNPDAPIAEEFALILQSLSLGRSRKDALAEFAKRAPIETVKEFTSSLIQAEDRGNPIVDVLQIQAQASRMRKSVRAEEAAAKAGVAMSGPVMLVFFSVLILILAPSMLGLKNTL